MREKNGRTLHCVRCSEIVQGEWNYCLWCGAEVPGMYCSECDERVLKEWDCCPECGEEIPDDSAPAIAPMSSIPVVDASSSVYDEDIPF